MLPLQCNACKRYFNSNICFQTCRLIYLKARLGNLFQKHFLLCVLKFSLHPDNIINDLKAPTVNHVTPSMGKINGNLSSRTRGAWNDSSHFAALLDLRKTGLENLPFGSLWDGVDPATGIYHSSSWLQQQLMEGSLPEELLKLLVTHFLQGLHTAVVQRVGTSAVIMLNMTFLLWKVKLSSLQEGQRSWGLGRYRTVS